MWVTQRHHQHERAGQRAGDHLPPRLHLVHGLQVDEPDRGVEEMRGGEGEEDQPRGDPEALSQVSPQQDVHWLQPPARAGPQSRSHHRPCGGK